MVTFGADAEATDDGNSTYEECVRSQPHCQSDNCYRPRHQRIDIEQIEHSHLSMLKYCLSNLRTSNKHADHLCNSGIGDMVFPQAEVDVYAGKSAAQKRLRLLYVSGL